MPSGDKQPRSSNAASPAESAGGDSLVSELMGAVRRRPLLVIGIALGVCAFLGGTGYFVAVVSGRKEMPTPSERYERALEALDQQRYTKARKIAKPLYVEESLPLNHQSGPAFILGAAMAYEAAEISDPERALPLHLVAARYLEQARQTGFPAQREAEGAYLLAKSLFGAHQYRQCRKRLVEALKLNPDRAAELLDLGASTSMRDLTLPLEPALAASSQYLQLTLSPHDARAGWLRHARLLLRAGRHEQAAAVLPRLRVDGKPTAWSHLLAGQIGLAAGAPSDEPAGSATESSSARIEAAITDLRAAQSKSDSTQEVLAASMYLIGVGYEKLGKVPEAVAQYDRARRFHADTPAGLAAALAEGRLLLSAGAFTEAVTAYRNAINMAPKVAHGGRPWTSPNAWRQSIESAVNKLLAERMHTEAMGLVEAAETIMPAAALARLEAQAWWTWAEHESQSGGPRRALAGPAGSLQATSTPSSRKKHRRAAAAYLESARLDPTSRQYTDAIWRAAEAYHRGRDFGRAERMLRKYLSIDAQRRQSDALLLLAKCQLARRNAEAALATLEELTGLHPTSPAVYEGRNVAAQAWLDMQRLDNAVAAYNANLLDGRLTPDSREWRASLFGVGEAYYRSGRRRELERTQNAQAAESKAAATTATAEGDLRRAAEKLTEAVRRFPNDVRSLRARYIVGECYRLEAQFARRSLRQASAPQARLHLNRRRVQVLQKALTSYRNLQSQLNDLQRRGRDLASHEQAMLRNCYLAQGHVLFELGRYTDAIDAYSSASSRYQDQPIAIEAFAQIAACHRRLGQAAAARGVLERAKTILKRIKPDADFARTTRYDRKQWQAYLNWMTGTADATS